MKSLALIIGAIALALLFLFPKKETEEQSPQQKVNIKSIAVTPVSTPKQFVAKSVPPMSLDALRIVKGKVEEITQNGVVFLCDLKTPPDPLNYPGNENSKEAMAPVLKFYEQEVREYGKVKIIQNGNFFSEDWHDGILHEDRVLVVDWPSDSPIAVGNKMRVGAVPTGDIFKGLRVYTVKFPLKPGVSIKPPMKISGFD